ncbi:MAG: dephospho-CoA kinase [Patescibacteria group bacterium]
MEFGNKTFVLGITGVIGSGKSELCRFLAERYGFIWIEADKIVHELYKVGRPGYEVIRKKFGEYAIGAKEVNRKWLREFVLKDPRKIPARIRTLNRLIHSLVAAEMNKKIVQLKAQHKSKTPLLICIEAVYFKKKNLGKFVDKIITVDAPDKEILRRLRNIKVPQHEIKRLIDFQRGSSKVCG